MSSLTSFGSAGEKALKGHSIFLALNGPFLLGLTQQKKHTETLHSQFPMCKLKKIWRFFPFYKARFYTFFSHDLVQSFGSKYSICKKCDLVQQFGSTSSTPRRSISPEPSVTTNPLLKIVQNTVLLHNGGFCNGCITLWILLSKLSLHRITMQHYLDHDEKHHIFITSIFYPREVLKQDHYTFIELHKNRFVMRPLQNPSLCSSLRKTVYMYLSCCFWFLSRNILV